ncbi:hypothetical protein ABN247_03750 [Morganella morganii]
MAQALPVKRSTPGGASARSGQCRDWLKYCQPPSVLVYNPDIKVQKNNFYLPGNKYASIRGSDQKADLNLF